MKSISGAQKTGFLFFFIALVLRLFVAILSPGTDDVQNFIRTARLTQQGLVVYQYHEAYPYPPLYAWVLAGTLNFTDRIGLEPGFSVRLPAILADSIIAVIVFQIASHLNPKVAPKIGWLYAFNPITIMITSHHGQFDPLAYLMAILAVWSYQITSNHYLSALLLGLGGALKVSPLFLAPTWLPSLSRTSQRFFFVLLTLLPFALALLIGVVMAPQQFIENVLGYRIVAEGGWGYNFITLLIEHIARWFRMEVILALAWRIRSLHQHILIAGILLTAWLVRREDILKRTFLIQISVQLFAGRWGHEYTAWIVPLAILSNQQGVLPWGVLTILWMITAYTGFVTTLTHSGRLAHSSNFSLLSKLCEHYCHPT